MNSFSIIPITALIGYVFFLMAFVAAKKTKLINSFIYLLIVMIAWTGGSFAMRQMMWPSVRFWFHISLTGMLFMPLGFLNFIEEFLAVNRTNKKILFVITTVILVINAATEWILATPRPIEDNGKITFVYTMHWQVVILFAFCVIVILRMMQVTIFYWKRNDFVTKQLTPILIGILVLFVGHVCLLLPFFQGFPIDLLSGIINIIFIFYALYAKRICKLTLLISKGNCYILSMGLVVILYYYMATPLKDFIVENVSEKYSGIIIILIVMIVSMTFYHVIQMFFDKICEKEELAQTENLRKFSMQVSKSLNIRGILDAMVEVIQKTVQVEKVYICIADDNHNYEVFHTTSRLDRRSLRMSEDHPVVRYLQNHDGSLLMKDFKCTSAYKSMWEDEKRLLSEWKIECFLPLKDEDDLIGIVMLEHKEKYKEFTFEDLNFLESVESISAIAVKNSRLYEKAYEEARKDELTGLYNRKCFYELLHSEYMKCKKDSLALVMVDIDDFKLYNQLYGNQEGDAALIRVSEIIRATVGENGYVARYEGKRFGIILPGKNLYEAKHLAENISGQIRQMNSNRKDYSFRVLTVSCGISAIPYSAATEKELIHNTDMAVYNVKRSGKNGVFIYTEGESKRRTEGKQEQRKSAYKEYASTIYALTAAIDTKDHYTFNHSKNVAYYAGELAKIYGLDQNCIDIVREAGLLHDIGKIGIPENILNKPGKLTEDEYEIIKTHVENSIGIIRHLPSLDYVIPAVLGHHERYDGKGYPRRMKGEDIPLMGRMLCIADSFDAMLSKRSYKDGFPLEKVLRIVEEEAGKQFDPRLSELLIQAVRDGRIKCRTNAKKHEELME